MMAAEQIGVKYDSGIYITAAEVKGQLEALSDRGGDKNFSESYNSNYAHVFTFAEGPDRQTHIAIPDRRWWKNAMYPDSLAGNVPIEQVSVMRINKDFDDARAAAQEFINDHYVYNGGVLGGVETEFDIQIPGYPQDRTLALPHLRGELVDSQREDAGGIANSTSKIVRAAANRALSMLITAVGQWYTYNQSSMPPTQLNISSIELNRDFPYVPYMAKAINNEYVTPYFDTMDAQVKAAWDKIARDQEFDGFGAMIDCVNNDNRYIAYWFMNSGHASMSVPVDADGRSFEQIHKNIGNSLTIFSSLINVPAYSGGRAFGSEVLIDEDMVHDSRALLSKCVATAMPTRIVRRDESVEKLQVEGILSGLTHTFDRAGTRTEEVHDPSGQELVGTHATLRHRRSVTWSQYQKAMQENDLKSLGKSTRIEYTDRSMTPDMVKYEESLALQEIAHLAGLQATAEGYNDFTEWLMAAREGGVILSQKCLEELNVVGFAEAKAALRGNYNEAKIEVMDRLIDYLSRVFDDSEHLQRTCAIARQSLQSMRDWQSNQNDVLPQLSEKQSGIEKFLFYLDNRNLFPNWGSFINYLGEHDCRDIIHNIGIRGRGNQLALILADYKDKQEIGDLLAAVNHLITYVSAEQILTHHN